MTFSPIAAWVVVWKAVLAGLVCVGILVLACGDPGPEPATTSTAASTPAFRITPLPILTPASRDYGDEADAAGEVIVGESIDSTIGHASDLDFFGFRGLAGQIYRAEVRLGTLFVRTCYCTLLTAFVFLLGTTITTAA